MEFRSKELSHEKRGVGGGEGGGGVRKPSFPSPTPSFLFWLSSQFRAGKIPFLVLSLLPNPTETLATQANKILLITFPNRINFGLKGNKAELMCNLLPGVVTNLQKISCRPHLSLFESCGHFSALKIKYPVT